ncbi:glycosyltransferase family 4 protein [Paenibacillus sp. J22TS3]|uniref:glycosyltransferase family 4 protein n=1 Tax=Paenibacillus sp. J22TS3 TaxID=2807192 RepID=UPI001B122D6F|nr:glycosyltransferase family 4 protein [Paenibacillus sp. J22TS3]GIP22008.1 glycosyl transferase family 1 [Paenibacillus sp. J22TS3]
MGKTCTDHSVPRKAAYVATVYAHLAAFHLPFMEDLRQDGWKVHAYAGPDHRRQKVESAGFACRDIPFSRSPLAWGNVRALFQMIRRLRKENYELIHVHTPNASLITRLAAWLAGARGVVYTAHGFHFHQGGSRLGWLLYYPLERMMSRLTDLLITINSEDFKRAENFPVRGRLVYIPGVGVDLEGLNRPGREVGRLKRELGINGDTLTVLCVAELNRNKNQAQLIHAVHSLVRRETPVTLLLAGVGSSEEICRDLSRELGLAEQVKFLGFRQDIPELMAAADVIALTSRREGLPKVLLEGLAAGKPLLVTDVRGSRDLVVQADNGYVVPLDDAEAAASALLQLYEDPSLRERMGRRSRQMSLRYDLKRIRSLMRELYNEVLHGGYGRREERRFTND